MCYSQMHTVEGKAGFPSDSVDHSPQKMMPTGQAGYWNTVYWSLFVCTCSPILSVSMLGPLWLLVRSWTRESGQRKRCISSFLLPFWTTGISLQWGKLKFLGRKGFSFLTFWRWHSGNPVIKAHCLNDKASGPLCPAIVTAPSDSIRDRTLGDFCLVSVDLRLLFLSHTNLVLNKALKLPRANL